MSSDFDRVYDGLGLAELAPKATCDATFLPQWASADTVISGRPVTDSAGTSGTLPRLQLLSPDAVAGEKQVEDELTPLLVLGEGGMGRVLLARQGSLGRDVAVKVLRAQSASEGAARALIQEARTTGSLEHPSVVPVYALARDGHGLPALVMKRVEGLSWRELIQTPEHPAWQRLMTTSRDRLAFHIEVLVQVCNAVAHAHRRGVLHRDVKPANVLVGELGEVYLADWGVAISRADAASQAPRLAGTPAYLAPEMVSGDPRHTDERTDVYLLGATLHEVLTGSPPHPGTVLREVMEHAYRCPAPTLGADVPALLAAVCTRAMAKEPAERFPSATALRDELRRFLQHRGSTALALAALERLRELEALAGTPLDEAGQRRWYNLVSECRFGFTQALKDSPDHAEARDGLERCLQVAVGHELERGSAAAARAFLAELPSAPPALVARVVAAEAAEVERRRLAREFDPEIGVRQRNYLLLAISGAISVMVASLFFFTRDRAIEQYSGWFRLVPLGFIIAIFGIAAFVGRKTLFSTRINRQMMTLVGVACFGVLANRTFSLLLGAPVHAALASDAVLLAALSANAVAGFHKGFLVSVAFFLAAAGLCAVFPALSVAVFGVATVLGVASAALVYMVWRKDLLNRS